MNGILDHLYTQIQAITAPPLISPLYKSPQQPQSLFPACYVFIGRFLVPASNSGNSSTLRAQDLPSQTPL
jgi:hypothetical protein